MIATTLGSVVKLILASPLVIVLGIIGLGLFVPRIRARPRLARNLIIAGWVALLLVSLPILPYLALSWVEDFSPTRRISDYPEADIIFVAGGTAHPPNVKVPEAEETGGNRLAGAVRLFVKKKAPLILVAGGYPYEFPPGEIRNQARDMADVLISLGVPESAIVQQTESINTEQDVRLSLPLFREKKVHKILAVTDALHMRRLMYFFPKGEFEVTPVPVARQSHGFDFNWQSFRPSAGWTEQWTSINKELIGYVYAKFFR